jgi:hypothetical protein
MILYPFSQRNLHAPLLLGFDVFFRVSVEFLFAHRRAEVVGFALVFRLPFGGLWVHFHLADNI